MRRVILLAILVFITNGCAGYAIRKAPTENEKQLNHQNVGAGKYISESAQDPAVKQAGEDVQANATTLAISPVGTPEKPEPYTPAASEKLREVVQEEAELPWWKKLITAGTIATFGGIMLRLAGRFLPSLLGPAGGALAAVVEGIEAAKSSAGPGGKTIELSDLVSALKGTQEKAGVRAHVTRVIKRVNGNS